MIHRVQKITFHFYRYQILPISKEIQITHAPYHINSVEELIKKKNQFFEETLLGIDNFKFSKTELEHKFIDTKNNIFILRIGANRGIRRIKKDFTEERLENWPNSLVIFNNDRKVQKVAVQHNVKVFGETQTIIKFIESNLNKRLHRYQLAAVFKPISEKKHFWKIVHDNKNKILIVDFELITPNLSNISKGISEDLISLQKSTNTLKSNVKLQSDKTSSLDLSEENNLVKQLVEYASQGGGNIKLQIRGYKKYINTAKNIKQETFDELQIERIKSDNAGEIIPEIVDP